MDVTACIRRLLKMLESASLAEQSMDTIIPINHRAKDLRCRGGDGGVATERGTEDKFALGVSK